MIIKWLGHSSFQLINKHGGKLVTDPYDEKTGYELPYPEADVVTCSHDHGDHNYMKGVKGHFELVNTTGSFSLHGFDIKGYESFHDAHGGKDRGNNIIYMITTDGLRICHLGDLGHIPSEQLAADIGKVDILMVPTGGYYTIDEKGARDTCDLLDPQVVIPMHYKTPDCVYDISPVERFVEQIKKIEYSISYHYSNELEITPALLPKRNKVTIMDYK